MSAPLPKPIVRNEILLELGRELRKRREVFPRWIEAGRITETDAALRVARLQAAYDYIMQHMPE